MSDFWHSTIVMYYINSQNTTFSFKSFFKKIKLNLNTPGLNTKKLADIKFKVDDHEYAQESESLSLKGESDNSAGNVLNESAGNVIDNDSEASGSQNVGKKEAKYPKLSSLNRFLKEAGYSELEKHLATEYKPKVPRYKGMI